MKIDFFESKSVNLASKSQLTLHRASQCCFTQGKLTMMIKIYAQKIGNQIMFDQCKCGALLTEHQHSGKALHHGPCFETGCKGFQFEQYISENELVSYMTKTKTNETAA